MKLVVNQAPSNSLFNGFKQLLIQGVPGNLSPIGKSENTRNKKLNGGLSLLFLVCKKKLNANIFTAAIFQYYC